MRTSSADVKATADVLKSRTLVSLASWAAEPQTIRLTIDWKALGIDPSKARIVAPAVAGFQDAATFEVGGSITVEPGKGRLLWID